LYYRSSNQTPNAELYALRSIDDPHPDRPTFLIANIAIEASFHRISRIHGASQEQIHPYLTAAAAYVRLTFNQIIKLMRKTLAFILLLIPLLMTNCSKEADVEIVPSLATKLKGTWTETSLVVVFYNASGEKLYEQANAPGKMCFDGSSTVTATYADRPTVTASYTISSDNTGNYLHVSNDEESRIYKIISISDTQLTLTLEKMNDHYLDKGTLKPAAKSLLTSTMTKEQG
jgi:hypothetical protein